MSRRPTNLGWSDDLSDDEADTSRLIGDNPSSYQSTEQIVRDHEQGLDKLGEAIKRQKYMANELATEVGLHNEIIDGIDAGLTTTNTNLQKNTRNINLVMKKSSTFFLWFLIVVLTVVIVTLAVW